MRRFLAVLGALVVASPALADFANRVVANAPNAIAGFQGSENFSGAVVGGQLDVDVDYAVFAPGDFAGTFNEFPGLPAFDPNDYVYAYQVYNIGAANGGTSTTAVSQMAINLSSGGLIGSLGEDPDFDPSPNDVPATAAFDFGDSALYLYLNGGLPIDNFGVVLLLSSPFGPAFVDANVVDGGGNINGFLPGPIPEPTSLLLLVAGLGVASLRRR